MVRGTSRRVIVVESPDTNLFEQAIFIVRNDALSKDGVTAQQLVDEVAASPGAIRARTARAGRCCGAARPVLERGGRVCGIALVWLLTALV